MLVKALYNTPMSSWFLNRRHGRDAHVTKVAARQICVAVSVLSALAATSICRADVWLLSTSDFQTETVILHGLDERGAAVTTTQSQNAHTVALDQFLEITRAIPVRQHPSPFVLRLRNGDLLSGEPVSLAGESIVWREDVTGETKIPLREAISFGRSGTVDARTPAPASDDAVKLANGDAVHGVMLDLTGSSVSIQPTAGGDATSIPLGSVSAVEFASLGGVGNGGAATSTSASAVTQAFRVHLSDDSVLTANSVHGDDWSMHLSFPHAPARDVPLAAIESIEQINGPVVWLSSLTPVENVQTPFLQAEYPARFDRNVLGGPIQFGDRDYSHGIGVHAYSRLSWPIDPADGHFRTQYAVDGDAPYANVNVQIKLDGEVVHWRKGLRAGELSPVIDLDLKGKHTLTLEVIDGQNEGVQARLNWIEPAFLRTSATTQP